MNEYVSFMNIPVKKDPSLKDSSRGRPVQRPFEELVSLIEAVINDPNIVECGWTQYTPYFNDGELCIFTVQGFWVRTRWDHVEDEDPVPDEWEEDFSISDYYLHPTLGGCKTRWDMNSKSYVEQSYQGSQEKSFRRCQALAKALESGCFDDALLAKEEFGDHCQVRISRDRVRVDFYEHD